MQGNVQSERAYLFIDQRLFKNFHEKNFHSLVPSTNIFNIELFPNCGI